MIDTLFRIGKSVMESEVYGSTDDLETIISPPLIKKRKTSFKLYTAELVFNLDQEEVYFGDLYDYKAGSEDRDYKYSAYSLRCVKTLSPNSKKICLTVPSSKISQLEEALFSKLSKDGQEPHLGNLREAISRDFSELGNSQLCRVLDLIFPFRNRVLKMFTFIDKEGNEKTSDASPMNNYYSLKKNEEIVMLFVSVIASEYGIKEALPLASLQGYDEFLNRKFLEKNTNKKARRGLCYVQGYEADNVDTLNVSGRDSFAKIFQNTTLNFASNFTKKSFVKNYQISDEAQEAIEIGSKYVLKNNIIKIAGIKHCIIPHFLQSVEVDVEQMTSSVKDSGELLFRYRDYEGIEEDFNYVGDDFFMVSFIGIDNKTGTYFKVINEIKDVSKTHLTRVLETLSEVDNFFSGVEGIDWNRIMTFGTDKRRVFFNLNAIYNIIPVRKGKKGVLLGLMNPALLIFKSILEQRKIDVKRLFSHFKELILCHRFERYGSYQIWQSNFDFAIGDSVYQYHAFIHFLKQLNLINMNSITSTDGVEQAPTNDYEKAIHSFFEKMEYDNTRQGLFYLGRALSSVAYAQYQSGHKSKPILKTLNYNGMDVKAIKRLYAGLMEKCLQYKKYDTLSKNEKNFSAFTRLFNPNQPLSSEEHLFYILAGYAFRIDSNKGDKVTDRNVE